MRSLRNQGNGVSNIACVSRSSELRNAKLIGNACRNNALLQPTPYIAMERERTAMATSCFNCRIENTYCNAHLLYANVGLGH
jgi:hypothetical protein